MKTIKQIANEQGKTKEGIRKHIIKIGLLNSLKKDGNKLVIDELQEALIIKSLNEKPSLKTQTKTQTETQTQTVGIVELLKEQLQIKDKQLAEANKSLQQEQELHRQTKWEYQNLLVAPENTESKQESQPQGDKEIDISDWTLWERIRGKRGKNKGV